VSHLEKHAYAAGCEAALSKFGSASKQLRLAVLHAVDEIAPILVRKITNKQKNPNEKKRRKK
jgi:hypothetical protein